MSSLRRMLDCLDLFTPEQPTQTAEEIAATLGCSTATAYRYLAELCRAGLIARVGRAYTLGGRIIELDYVIRAGDPVLQAALPVMRELRGRTGCDVLLTEMVGGRILASHHERGTDTATVSFGRGRPMPLFRGAGSKVILAALPTPRLRTLHAAQAGDIATASLGESWAEFRSMLAGIRRAGYAISLGELDPQNVGIAAPVARADGAPPSSLVLVLSRERWTIADKPLVAELVKTAASRIAAAVAVAQRSEHRKAETGMVFPMEKRA
jgi:DNA-binding IclR family transcriptional regulator